MYRYLDPALPAKGLIDTHFHCSMLEKRKINPMDLLPVLNKAGYSALLDIGTSIDDIAPRMELVKEFPFVYMSAGLYPNNAEHDDYGQLVESLKTYLSNSRIIAIGEIGLDYHWNYATKEKQKELFIQQLECAKEFHLPVCIHNRNADTDTINCLREAVLPDAGVIHCFSSGSEEVRQFLDLGFYISFAGNMTYPNAENIRDALKIVPEDRILLETDSPYLAPQQKRGKGNHPGYIQYIYKQAATLRNTPVEEFIVRLKKNFTMLFKVPLQE